MATSFRGQFFTLSDEDLFTLLTACTLHTVGREHPDITVQTCWDADRLDLMRVGIRPHPKYLNTLAAQQPDMIEWAVDRSCKGHVPAFAMDEWGCAKTEHFA